MQIRNHGEAIDKSEILFKSGSCKGKNYHTSQENGAREEVDYWGVVCEAHASSSRDEGIVGDKMETPCKHLLGEACCKKKMLI